MGVITNLISKPFNPRGNDQSPKGFNRAKLYSGKALDFDGTNDELSLDGFTMTGNTATLSFCLKADDWDANSFIFAAGTPEIVLGSTTGGNNLSFYDSSSWKTFGAISDTTSTNFFSIVFNGTSAIAYMNGVQFGSVLTITPINISSVADVKLMAQYSGGGLFFNGQLSGFKIFNTALTPAQVADLYNFPEKIVPTGVANTALKLWLPMQEGAGTTAINGAPDALGSELVINGTFDSAANWVHSAQYSISSGKASYDGTGSGKLYQTGKNLVATKKYILTFDVSNASTYAHMWIGNEPGSNSYTASNTYQTYYNGTNAVLFEGANIGTETTLAFWGSTVGSSFSIDNISLKEVANYGTISGATWQHGIGTPVAQTAVINWNKLKLEGGSTTNEYLVPQGLTSGRDLLGNLFTNVRKQGALNLDGNSWAEVHDNESLDITDAITLECWYYNDGSTDKGLLGKYYLGKLSYLLWVSSTQNAVRMFTNNLSTEKTGLSLGWHHVVGTYDGANRKIYVDGVLGGTDTYATDMVTSDEAVEIGRYFGTSTTAHTNQLAQPRIYNRALSAEEVQRNYDAGKNTYTN